MVTPKSVKSAAVSAHISDRRKLPRLAKRIGTYITLDAVSSALVTSSEVGTYTSAAFLLSGKSVRKDYSRRVQLQNLMQQPVTVAHGFRARESARFRLQQSARSQGVMSFNFHSHKAWKITFLLSVSYSRNGRKVTEWRYVNIYRVYASDTLSFPELWGNLR